MDEGFTIIEDVFSADECRGVSNTIDLGSASAGIRNLMSNDGVRSLANDLRLLDIAAAILGKPGLPYKATLFNKTSKANWLVAWHQDVAMPIEEFVTGRGWRAPTMKAGVLFAHAPASVLEQVIALRIHLDPSEATNGPLRVIPGSHSGGVLTDLEIDDRVSTGPPLECLARIGSVIAMRPLLVHASSKIVSDEPRKVLHIEYTSKQEFDGVRIAVA